VVRAEPVTLCIAVIRRDGPLFFHLARNPIARQPSTWLEWHPAAAVASLLERGGPVDNGGNRSLVLVTVAGGSSER
jgi:hypothetical protein